jgi:hypothetical protein
VTRIAVNGIELNVEVAGEGAPLLLLHGFTGDTSTWSPFLDAWPGHRLIMVDIIGHGRSDAPADSERYSMTHAVADLVALLDRLDVAQAQEPVDRRFQQLFVRHADGYIRSRLDGYDGTRMAGGCILNDRLPLTDDVRHRMLVLYELVNQYGPAWHNRFQNTYISTPENIMLMYWPEVPNWCLESTPFRYRPVEAFVGRENGENVASQETVWTAPFYDLVSASWRVSAETPVYRNDRQIATIGHDILADELLERALQQRREGTYNILLRADGRLILHPRLIEEITRKEGYFGAICRLTSAAPARRWDSIRPRNSAPSIFAPSMRGSLICMSIFVV